ncbi:Twin-arginine translocation pathway signal [Granulosicoccus antarcticus]|uniref:Twin-arginine translocation pathway signal n=1 Tax=Granulosicoccus antarcticus IMCC3135 TaxID=1192854 RepID=A0A2Z2NTH4_9GAMM|nr:Twin-arginine translocation pathway signal [Granulosicoccus antarcticus]ASJ74852.1 hypothetical protein IMCC3135_23915 [Granulosicoccus antarcticus IMCC3135]
MVDISNIKTIEFVRNKAPVAGKMTRRQLLKRGVGIGAGLMVGNGFLAAGNAAWALETKTLSPEVMATLVQMARDIYPHDRFGDELYAIAVKGHEEKAEEDADYKAMIEAGIASLDEMAKANGHGSYVGTGWEIDRVAILKTMEQEGFFQTVRGGLVVSLYNQHEVWSILGYEGSSFEKGGYLERGFDDVNWL